MKWVGKGIMEGFRELDEAWLKTAKVQKIYDGSTALLSFLIERESDLLLLNANLGDCRAVLCRDGKAVRLTKDHKPQDPDEKARIESLKGGFISRSSHSETWRVQGSLAVSRSFGDLDVKQPCHYVSAEPELTAFSITPPSDSFLIIGSDGLWDVISDQKAVELVSKTSAANGMNPGKCAESLLRKAIDESSKDNITVIVAFFRWFLE